MKTRLMFVDDHPMMRNGLRQAISLKPELELAGEASTGSAAIKLASEVKPDLIVMDVHLADANGIEVTRKVLESQPYTKIIMFSSDATRALVDDALQSGASGYLLKSGDVEELMRAIEIVMQGKLYLSADVNALILEDYRRTLSGEAAPSKPALSDREKLLLRLVAAGQRNKEIAGQLNISIKSVEAYRSRLMKKIDCGSSAEMVRYAIREGIVEA